MRASSDSFCRSRDQYRLSRRVDTWAGRTWKPLLSRQWPRCKLPTRRTDRGHRTFYNLSTLVENSTALGMINVFFRPLSPLTAGGELGPLQGDRGQEGHRRIAGQPGVLSLY